VRLKIYSKFGVLKKLPDMKKILFPFIMVTALWWITLLTGCNSCVDGTGHVENQTRTVAPFSEIVLNINADVVVEVVAKTTMQIHAQRNILDLITTRVKGKKLIIDASQCLGNTDPILIKVFTPNLYKLTVNGSGMIKTANPVTLGEMSLSMSGSGKIYADIHANIVNTKLSGSGDIIVNGSANKQNIDLKGSGNFKGLGMRTNSVEVDLSGSGKVAVSATNKLVVKLSGSGEVVYAGDPKGKTEVIGSGKVTKMD